MLVYLFLVLVSKADYQNPDYSALYFSSNSSILLSQACQSNILLISSFSYPVIRLLDINYNNLFAYNLQVKNLSTPIKAYCSNLIYLALNVQYSGETLPNLLGNQIPALNTIHGLLVILTYQGELVRNQ